MALTPEQRKAIVAGAIKDARTGKNILPLPSRSRSTSAPSRKLEPPIPPKETPVRDDVLVSDSGLLNIVLGSDGFIASRQGTGPWSKTPPFKLTGAALADFNVVPNAQAEKLSSEARTVLVSASIPVDNG